MNSLEVHGLTVAYGGLVAVDSVSLCVQSGTTVAIIGSNGAGKSSLLNSIVGIVPKSGGRVLFEGKDVTTMPAYDAPAAGISLSPEGRRLFPELTILENLKVGAMRTEKARAKRCLDRVLTLFPRLRERLSQQAGTLSGGEQQMCALGRALMTDPRLLMLDEPSLGLAPKVIVEVATAIRDISRGGTGVLLVEQNAVLALNLSSYGYVFESGKIVREGASSALLADTNVQSIYLGKAIQ
jgi:branched-chain amino acid transport system ATP-binding protein